MSKSDREDMLPVLIVGAGPAGLVAAIQVKVLRPSLDVCVIDKAADLGQHALSGAVLESEPLFSLLDQATPGWRETDQAKDLFTQEITVDDTWFLTRTQAIPVGWGMRLCKALGLGFGQMTHMGDHIVSVSGLVRWLGQIARSLGVEVLTGFAAEDVLYDERASAGAVAVKLVDQGLTLEGDRQPNYLAGEVIEAKVVVLAEGCDGLLTEKFIQKAGLRRNSMQLYSVAVKELIRVSSDQYHQFGGGHVIHAMGYPLWRPMIGPAMFGGGIVYAGPPDHLIVGMIVGADWRDRDFNPQEALTLFKGHPFIGPLIESGTVVEAGAKMIPEGGFHAIPRDPATGSIGKGNCLILGDSAGFVNMLKIKGLHLAMDSGIQAARAIVQCMDSGQIAAVRYTELVEESAIFKELRSARNFRQTVARWGPLIGMPLSMLGGFLPRWQVEPDYKAMRSSRNVLRSARAFDKDLFAAKAGTAHREDQPCHLHIREPATCQLRCESAFGKPCITFCPAGVYETIGGSLRPAHPSNCLHCKTCQRKCPFDNIRWTVPEGGGGPRYRRM